MGGGADDPSYSSFGSRWGIKGSSEVSEGLTAVYKFETRVGQGDASQDTNQLYTGLSGGFGSLTLGKQSGAAYNHSGAIRDISNWHSHGDVGSRISNALSYSYAAESFSMQVAAIMDGGEDADTDGAVDRVEFGMTVGLGDIGKVAIGYEKQEDSMKDGKAVMDATLWNAGVEHSGELTFVTGSPGKVEMPEGHVWRNADHEVVTGEVEIVHTNSIVEVYYDGSTTVSELEPIGDKLYDAVCHDNGTLKTGDEACTKTTKVWATVAPGTPTANDKDPDPVFTLAATQNSGGTTATITPTATTYGHKASHISASFGLAGITVALGHTTKDSNSPMMNDKEKTNFLGASGSIGDTGLSWNAWGRNVKNYEHVNGDDRSPWTVGLAKSLGGGATTFIEHYNADDGEDGTTSVALRVDF